MIGQRRYGVEPAHAETTEQCQTGWPFATRGDDNRSCHPPGRPLSGLVSGDLNPGSQHQSGSLRHEEWPSVRSRKENFGPERKARARPRLRCQFLPTRPNADIAVRAAAYAVRDFGTSSLRRVGLYERTRMPTATQRNIESIQAAAALTGVAAETLPGNFLKLTRGPATYYVHSSDFPFESLVPYLLCGDKTLTSRLLAEGGLPVPRSRAFGLSHYKDAQRFFEELPKPVVTKPARGTAGGAGITMDLNTKSDFRDGFARAGASGKDVLVEEQVDGENLRITILDGEVLGAVRRIPARVVGDGVSSVRVLVEARNSLWRARGPDNRMFGPIAVDLEARRLLHREGMNPSSVPAKGREVQLRRVSNASRGGEIGDVSGELHEDLRELALEAAEVMGPKLCGVDLIAQDPTRSRHLAPVFINEVNTTPGLAIANAMVDGQPSTYASERILRYLFDLGQ